MEYTYAKCECSHCGRKILVERTLVGVSHTSSIHTTCLDCLMKKGLNADFKKQRPTAAQDIVEWYGENDSGIRSVELEGRPGVHRFYSSVSTITKETRE